MRLSIEQISDMVEVILADRHHENLCSCEGWPTACENGLTTFTFSPLEVIEVARPIIIEHYVERLTW